MGEQIITRMFALLGFKVEDKGLKDFSNGLNVAKLKVLGLATVFAKFANDTLKSFTRLDNFTKRTGIGEEFAADFMNIAKASNISADTVLNSLETISEARQNFLRGEGNIQPWALLGVDITKNPEQVFKDILDKIENIKDAGLRTKLLKDAGLDPQLFNITQNKGLGTNKLLNMNKGDLEAIGKLNKEINILKLNLTLLKDKVVVLLTPFKFIVELVNRLVYGLVDVIERTLGFNNAMAALKIILVGLAVYLHPIIALFIGIGLVIDDFLTFLRDGDSVIGTFIEWIKNLIKNCDWLNATFDFLGKVLNVIIELMKYLWNGCKAIIDVFINLGQIIKDAFSIQSLTDFVNVFKNIIGFINNLIKNSPIGKVISAGKWAYNKIKGKKEGELVDGENDLNDLNNAINTPSIPSNLGNISNSNKTNNNNVQITNNMNISGNNAKEIADNIKEQEMGQLIDNMTMELN